MSLNDRLSEAKNSRRGRRGSESDGDNSHLDEIKRRLHYQIIEDLGPELDEDSEDDSVREGKIEDKLRALLAEETTPLSQSDKSEITEDVIDNILGYGPIDIFLKDPDITEIMVNSEDTIYVEKEGQIHPTNRQFIDRTHLMTTIDKIVSQVGRRIDESVPMVDARLPDGSRVNAIVHPLALDGPKLTIRKFATDPYMTEDLIRFGTMTERMADFLRACVEGRLNILISGGTGTGKTTTLNVLSSYVPEAERIVTVEDTAELQLHQEHVLRLESRSPNIEGKGTVTVRDLVRNTLRMRPDRIIVGEVRGGESLDMLQAMNTGHDGSLSTIHANSPRDALARVETMVLMSGLDLPVRAIREQIGSALNLLIHLARLSDGSRRVVQISEIEGLEGDTVVLQDLFLYDYSAGRDSSGKFKGHVKSTGIRPKFGQRLKDMGITLAPDIFALETDGKK